MIFRGSGRSSRGVAGASDARRRCCWRKRAPASPSAIGAGGRRRTKHSRGSSGCAVRRSASPAIWLLIVNHGIWPPDEVTVAALTDAQWDATRRANLDSVLYVCRAAIPLLPDGGKIVLVSSTAGQRGEPFHADYAATKGAVISFTKSLAVELGPRRINVNCVAPGWVDTEMSATPYARDAGRGKEEIERTIPLGRVASPEDCAGPIVFLCSDLAGHITGEILNVNGGSVLCG